jgi:hypothetical protein
MPPPSQTAAAVLDKDLAASAIKKLKKGATPTPQEAAALKRYEKQREEQLRWQYYATIPQKHWRQMSGRQTKVINEQAERYGIPFGGKTVDLSDVVRGMHDFLATNAVKLARDGDPMEVAVNSPALERYREERAALAKLDRLEREGTVIDRNRAREALGRIAALLRAAGDALQRQYGPGAGELFNEVLVDAQREIERSFGQPSAEPAV